MQFLYNENREVVAEKDYSGNIIRYIRGLGLISSDSENAKTYYHYVCDEQGSVSRIIRGEDKENGAAAQDKVSDRVLNHYEYDAFGNTISCEERVANRFRYQTSYGKSREIIQCNTKDAAADELAKRIGGQSRSAFADDPIQREFDVISDQYIAQAKPPLKCVNKTVRTQMKATFEAAKKYERKIYYQFEGIPSQEVLDKLYEYSERYGVEVIIDTEPLGILN